MSDVIKLNTDPTILTLTYPDQSGMYADGIRSITLNRETEFLVSRETAQKQLYENVSKWSLWAAVEEAITDAHAEKKRELSEYRNDRFVSIQKGWNKDIDGNPSATAINARIEREPKFLALNRDIDALQSNSTKAHNIKVGYERQQSSLQTVSANLRESGDVGAFAPAVVHPTPRPGTGVGTPEPAHPQTKPPVVEAAKPSKQSAGRTSAVKGKKKIFVTRPPKKKEV